MTLNIEKESILNIYEEYKMIIESSNRNLIIQKNFKYLSNINFFIPNWHYVQLRMIITSIYAVLVQQFHIEFQQL